MSRKVTSYRLPEMTLGQIKALTEHTGSSDANVISLAIDRMYQKEMSMKTIKVGEVNDCYIYAIKIDGCYVPLNEQDLNFEKPDAKIYYDSGIYPGVTNLPQHICSKASNR
jgi:predicted DNA-binding protein